MMRFVAIVGPTASGKTALSIAAAKKYGCEIVNCDSMQIYEKMNIGTAKPTFAEREGIPHHLLDFLSPDKSFSAEAYRELAMEAISDITARGKLPLLVGGTGLYLDTLLRAPTPDVPPSDPKYRDAVLSSLRTEEDIEALWQRLLSVDSESALAIHKNNVKRVIRALEVYDATGKPKSYWDRLSREGSADVCALIAVLDFHNRETLYERIDKRVDIMMRDGLEDEVRGLLNEGYLGGDDTASGAIGYKELIGYLRGECSLSESVEKIKLASRRYAKRQLTWFRHESDAKTIYMDNADGSMRAVSEPLSELSDMINYFLRNE